MVGSTRFVRALPLILLGVAVGFLSACSPLNTLNHLLVTDDGWTIQRDIAYGAEQRQRLDVYRPAGAAMSCPAPVVVFFYGGAWSSGQRSYYRFIGESLTSRGYVVVIPDYRVYPDVRFPDFVADGAKAVAWVQRNVGAYGGDPRRLFLMGHSAGAHIAALLAVDRRYLDRSGADREAIRGLVGLAGPYGFDPMLYRSTRPIFETASSVEETQPLSFVAGGEPPMLLLHGVDDTTVFPVNSTELARRVREAGGQAEAVELADTGHIGIVLAYARVFRREGGVRDATLAFLDAHAAPEVGGSGPGADTGDGAVRAAAACASAGS